MVKGEIVREERGDRFGRREGIGLGGEGKRLRGEREDVVREEREDVVREEREDVVREEREDVVREEREDVVRDERG